MQDLVDSDRANQTQPLELTTDPLLFPHLYPPQHYRRRRNTRRLSKNPIFMPELRILRRDIRRRYAEMFVNVINSHDLPLLIKFVQEFCRPDCRYIKDYIAEGSELQALREAMDRDMVTDLNGMIEIFAFCFLVMPDSFFTLKESQLRVKQGVRETQIFAKIAVTATRLYSFEIIDETRESMIEESQIIPSGDSSDDASSVESSFIDDEISLFHALKSPCFFPAVSHETKAHPYVPVINPTSFQERFRWTKIPVPMETRMDGILSFTLDERNQIRNLRASWEGFSERPFAFAH